TFIFHLGYVKSRSVRQQVVNMFGNVDTEMATLIAEGAGVNPPNTKQVNVTASSPVLSLENQVRSAATQKVGVLIGNNFNDEEVMHTLKMLEGAGVFIEVVSDRLGSVRGKSGSEIKVDKPFLSTYEVLYDSLYVVGGTVENEDLFN